MGYYYIKTDYLEHSSGPWKKHKYSTKTKKNGKWVYSYPDGDNGSGDEPNNLQGSYIGGQDKEAADRYEREAEIKKKISEPIDNAKKYYIKTKKKASKKLNKFKKEAKKQLSSIDGDDTIGKFKKELKKQLSPVDTNGSKSVGGGKYVSFDDDTPKPKKKKKKDTTRISRTKTVTWN